MSACPPPPGRWARCPQHHLNLHGQSGPSQAGLEGNRDLQSPHSVPQDSGSWENRKSPELGVSRPEFSTQLSLLSQLWGRYESPWVCFLIHRQVILENKWISTCNVVGTKIGNKAASSPEKKDIRPTVTAGSYCGESEVTQSCPTLCNPVDYRVYGILQARILELVAFPFFRGSSQSRNQTQVLRIAGGVFTS